MKVKKVPLFFEFFLECVYIMHIEQFKIQDMNKQSLEELLVEIAHSQLLSHEEEIALLKVVQEKGTDCDEIKQLEEANMRFIVSVAAQYQRQGLTLEELIEAGTEGLRKGAMKYYFEADYKFIAYAIWWIRQSIIQAITEKK